MAKTISIEYLPERLVDQAWDLVRTVFDACVAPDYSREGSDTYYEFITREYILAWKQQGRICLVAVHEERVVGIIDLRNEDHITMFFVHMRCQKRGIGRALLNRAIQEIRSKNPGVKKIDVNSSPFAVAIYRKLGFRQAGDERTTRGIRFTPLELDLQAAAGSAGDHP